VWKGVTKPLAAAALGAVALGTFFHYIAKGPNEVSKELEDELEKEGDVK
jgi:formate dehydrogenase iron-sulfur subunit